jgi:uncharacterized protein (DUF305 family)
MTQQQPHATPHDQKESYGMSHDTSYRQLAFMAALSFISMYVLMYAMVNAAGNVLNNLNQVYMAGLMAAPMVVFELILMKKMYKDRQRNAVIMAASILAALLFFAFIRQQTAVGDRQFLKSMIPHHAGAILMCEQSAVTDPEIEGLCDSIIASQQAEIDQMRAILDRLES